jgi:hypothetical protein
LKPLEEYPKKDAFTRRFILNSYCAFIL